METAQLGAATITDFEYQAADKAQDSDATFPVRSGLLAVLPDIASLNSKLPRLLERFPATADPISWSVVEGCFCVSTL